jgi:hypothetical protein
MERRRLLTATAATLCASALLDACAASSHYAHAPPPVAMQAPAPSGGVADAAESATATPEAAPQPAPPAPVTQRIPGGPATNTGGAAPSAATNAAATPAAPMLIYTADVQLQVEAARFDAVLDQVLSAARECGGFLLRRDNTSVSVRVPSARFHESLRAVEGMGEVLRRDVAAEDVSEEFRDAEVRLQNLRAVRQRLEEFLRRAGSMAEALQVERELERVTQEIDRVEGRLRFLSARVAFSLVTVSLHARPQVVAAPRTVTVVPPRRAMSLPVRWLHELGLDRLLRFGGED